VLVDATNEVLGTLRSVLAFVPGRDVRRRGGHRPSSTRLLVADVEDGTVRELERGLDHPPRRAVDTRRKLLPVAIARVRDVLTDTAAS
jgi:hypothetical protein